MDQNLTIFLAPICIIGGGGLIAFGALTLFGLDILFKTKSQAILGICVGLVLIGALEIRFYASGASFFENQKVVVGYCHIEAEKSESRPARHKKRCPQQVDCRVFEQGGI